MKKNSKGTCVRHDRFTTNEVDKEKNKPVANYYDTRYSNKMCRQCKQRKPPKGGKNKHNTDGTRTFICAECVKNNLVMCK